MSADNHVSVTSATVANGSKSLSIVGDLTGWLVPGYRFGNQAGSYWQIIDAVGTYSGGNTSITLAENWGGTNLSAVAAQIEIVSEGVTLASKVVNLINLLGNGALQTIASIPAVNDNVLQWKSGSLAGRTLAQFVDDLATAGAATLSSTQTLTNKTLGATTLPAGGSIDASGNVVVTKLTSIVQSEIQSSSWTTGQTITFTKYAITEPFIGLLLLTAGIYASTGESGVWLITITGTTFSAIPIVANTGFAVALDGSSHITVKNNTGGNRTMQCVLLRLL